MLFDNSDSESDSDNDSADSEKKSEKVENTVVENDDDDEDEDDDDDKGKDDDDDDEEEDDDDDDDDSKEDESNRKKNAIKQRLKQQEEDEDEDEEENEEDDEEEEEIKVKQQSTTSPPPSNKENEPSESRLFGSDSDSDDEEIDQKGGVVKNNSFGDDDAEFKDDGIVGATGSLNRDGDGDGNGGQRRIKKRLMILPKVGGGDTKNEDHDADGDVANHADVTIHVAALPKIIAIDPNPHVRKDKDDGNDYDEDNMRNDPRLRSTVRWRYAATADVGESGGQQRRKRESNARWIRWSDGTWGLAVGSEVFEVDEHPITTAKQDGNRGGKDIPLEYVCLSAKAETCEDADIDKDKENEDEKLPTTSSTVIECRAAMTSKLTLRPSSLQSAVHKNFALTEKNRNMKKVRTIAEHQSFVDPEKEKAERIQMKEDMLKEEDRKNKGGYGSKGRKKQRRSMNYDAIDDNEGGIYDNFNIGRAKKHSHNGDASDESDNRDDDAWDRRGQYQKNKKKRTNSKARDEDEYDESESGSEGSEDEGENEALFEEGSDEEENNTHVVQKNKKRTSNVFAEDDDSD